METENVQEQEEVVVQEENTTTEEEAFETQEETQDDDSVTLSKAEFKKLQRQSLAYKAGKDVKVESRPQPRQDGHSIDTLFLIKDLAADEYVSLKEEADDLGVPLERYLTSNSGKSVLSKMRAEKKSKDTSVSLNSKSPVFKKFTQEDLSKMTSKEMEKIMQ
jgi:hypothetical protein